MKNCTKQALTAPLQTAHHQQVNNFFYTPYCVMKNNKNKKNNRGDEMCLSTISNSCHSFDQSAVSYVKNQGKHDISQNHMLKGSKVVVMEMQIPHRADVLSQVKPAHV